MVLLLAVSFLPGGALGAGCSWGAQNIQIAPYLGCAPSSAQANACSQSCDAPMPCSRTGQIASAALACRALPPFLRRPRTSRSTTTTTACARVSRSNRWQSHARTPSTPGARRSSTTTTSSTPPPPHLAQVTSRPRCAILSHTRQERQRSRFPSLARADGCHGLLVSQLAHALPAFIDQRQHRHQRHHQRHCHQQCGRVALTVGWG